MSDFKPWTFAPKEFVRGRQRAVFRAQAAREEEARKAEEEKKKSRSWTSRVTGFAKDVAGEAFSTGIEVIDAPRKYAVQPLIGLPGVSQEDKTEESSWSDFARSLKQALTQDPRKTYSEAQESYEAKADTMPGWSRFGMETLTDPMNLVGIGLVGKAAKGWKPTSRAGKLAYTLLESPRGTVVGAAAGGAAGTRLAEETDDPYLKLGLTLGGAIAGGGIGGMKRPRWGAIAAEETPVFSARPKGLGPKLKKEIEGFELKPGPEADANPYLKDPLFVEEAKLRVKRNIENDYVAGRLQAEGPAQAIETPYGTFHTSGVKSVDQWIDEVERILTDDEIEKAAQWYHEGRDRFHGVWGPEQGERNYRGYFSSQVNQKVEYGMTDVLRARDKLAGRTPRWNRRIPPAVKEGGTGWSTAGSSGVTEASIMADLQGIPELNGKSQKILDFHDSGDLKRTRTWMADDERAGGPFAGDVWQFRDAGFIDSKMVPLIEKWTGKKLEELGLRQSHAETAAAAAEHQYEFVNQWGNQLTAELSRRGWRGKNDWLTGDIQAISWSKIRKLVGDPEATVGTAFDANTRRLVLPHEDLEVYHSLRGNVEAATGGKITHVTDEDGRDVWEILVSPEGTEDVAALLSRLSGRELEVSRVVFPSKRLEVVRFTPDDADPVIKGWRGAGRTQLADLYEHLIRSGGTGANAPYPPGTMAAGFTGGDSRAVFRQAHWGTPARIAARTGAGAVYGYLNPSTPPDGEGENSRLLSAMQGAVFGLGTGLGVRAATARAGTRAVRESMVPEEKMREIAAKAFPGDEAKQEQLVLEMMADQSAYAGQGRGAEYGEEQANWRARDWTGEEGQAAGFAGGQTNSAPGLTRVITPERDLLGAQAPDAVRAEAQASAGTLSGRLNAIIRRAGATVGGRKLDPNLIRDTDVTPFLVRERNRFKNLIDSYEGLADVLFKRLKNSGIELTPDANGDFRIAGTNIALEEVIEGTTPQAIAFRDSLTPAQAGALDDIVEFNANLNATLRTHGSKFFLHDPQAAEEYARLKSRVATIRRDIASHERAAGRQEARAGAYRSARNQTARAEPTGGFKAAAQAEKVTERIRKQLDELKRRLESQALSAEERARYNAAVQRLEVQLSRRVEGRSPGPYAPSGVLREEPMPAGAQRQRGREGRARAEGQQAGAERAASSLESIRKVIDEELDKLPDDMSRLSKLDGMMKELDERIRMLEVSGGLHRTEAAALRAELAQLPDLRQRMWTWMSPEEERAYFPRQVIGRNGEPRAQVPGRGGAPMGSSASFMKERVHETMQEGLEAGLDYADPGTAYRAMVRAKLRVAADSYSTNALRPLGMTSEQLKASGKDWLTMSTVRHTAAPSLQGLWFDAPVAERINAALDGRPAWGIRAAEEVNKVLTPLRATADISWYLQQGAAFSFRHPVKAANAAYKVIRSVGDERVFTRLVDSELARGPGLQYFIGRGLHWSADDVADWTTGVSQFGKGPVKAVSKFSNETFNRFGDYSRLVFANDAYERVLHMGLEPGTAAFDRELSGALNAVNRMTGWTGRDPSSLEKMAFFAPRYFSAAVEQTAAALSKGGAEGAIARAHMGRMLGFGALTVFMVNTANGKDTEFRPWKDNFLRFRDIGGLDVSPFGTYDTFFRALAQTVLKQQEGAKFPTPGVDPDRLWRLAEGKMSPALKLVYEPWIVGRTYTGEPIDPLGGWEGAGKAIYHEVKSSLPFGVQNIVEEGIEPAIEEKSPMPLLEMLPGTAASATGMTNSPVTPTEYRNWARDDVAREKFNMDYRELSGADKSRVNEDERVAKHQKEADKNALTKVGDRSKALKATLGTAAKIDELSKELESGKISGNQFREQYRLLQTELRGAREMLEQQGSMDKVLSGWFDLYDDAEKPDGSLDYDQLEYLQGQYRSKHPDVDDRLDKAIGTRDNETVRQYREAQKLAAEYYDLPAYRGLSLEQSQHATRVIMAAQDMASYGQARNFGHALRLIRQQDPEGVRLARLAQKRGANKDRARFRRAHPLFAKFYSDIQMTAA